MNQVLLPELSPDAPDYAKNALASVKEMQLVEAEKAKGYALNAISKTMKWLSDVADGTEAVVQVDSKGRSYTIEGPQYIFEHALQTKAMMGSIDIATGTQAAMVNAMQSAILGRTKEPPRRVNHLDIEAEEVVE